MIQREQPRAKSVSLENMHTEVLDFIGTVDVNRYL